MVTLDCFAGTGVNVYSLHPGVIRTQIIRYLPMWRKIIAMIVLMFLKSPREGAQTTIYCSVDESLGNKSGLYYRQVQQQPAKCLGYDIYIQDFIIYTSFFFKCNAGIQSHRFNYLSVLL